MSLTKRLGLIVGAAVSLSNVAMAQSTLDGSRAFANELYADSSTRASSLAGPAFMPAVHGYNMTRYTINNRTDADAKAPGAPAGVTVLPQAPSGGSISANDSSKITNGFSNAITAISISGNIFSEDWGYMVDVVNSSIAGGGVFLRNAYGTYKIGNGMSVKWGQFQSSFSKEDMVADTNQLALNRSVSDTYFHGGYIQGVEFTYAADAFRIMGGINDGRSSANTDYTAVNAVSFAGGGEQDLGLTARGEFMWAGKWDQYDQFTSFNNSAFFGAVGAGLNFETGGGTVGTQKNTLFGATADVMVKGNGWNAFAALNWMHIEKNPGTVAGQALVVPPPAVTSVPLKTDDIGLLAQGGIFVAPQWELFGRLDAIVADKNWGVAAEASNPASTYKLDETFVALALGANYYVVPDSQAIKLTAELEIFVTKPNGPAILAGNSLNGFLASPDGKSGQFSVAAQMQIVF